MPDAAFDWPCFDDTGFDLETDQIIRRFAHRLIQHHIFPASDLPDVEQSFRLKLWQSRHAFDPSKGPWLAFATKLIQNTRKSMLRDHFAGKRDPRRVVSLDNITTVGDLEPAIPATWSATPCGPPENFPVSDTSDHLRTIDMRIDVAQAVKILPPLQQSLCGLLMTDSVAATAEALQIPRSTCYGQLQQVRTVFENRDLQKYL